MDQHKVMCRVPLMLPCFGKEFAVCSTCIRAAGAPEPGIAFVIVVDVWDLHWETGHRAG